MLSNTLIKATINRKNKVQINRRMLNDIVYHIKNAQYKWSSFCHSLFISSLGTITSEEKGIPLNLSHMILPTMLFQLLNSGSSVQNYGA